MNRVIIMRGLPGSGKTTKAESYGGVIVSADDFFMHEGEYHYDRNYIGAAHERCRMDFIKALSEGEPTIVVDNTNTTHREYEAYIQMAEDAGYEVIIDVVDSGLSAEELAQRNTHGVPVEGIQRMMNRWES